MWTGDARVSRITRLVLDLSRGSVEGLRVIDLGCDEGNFSVALGRIGAGELVGIEARDQIASAREQAAQYGLPATFEQRDVRSVSSATHGEFDVVLCLGILYHLDTPDVFEFAANVHGLCKPGGFAVIETNISLSRPRRESWRGRDYEGKSYPEDITRVGASIDNPESFFPTRSSLFNLLQHVGFTSVMQVVIPGIPVIDQMIDHLVLVAFRGAPTQTDPPEPAWWPDRFSAAAHPTQGLRWRLLERLRSARGRSRMRAIFERTE